MSTGNPPAGSVPLVSVIIPTYNSERTISKTVASALRQTLQQIEVIIVDDGSTDATLQMLEGIADPRLKVLAYPRAAACGPAPGRNRGLREARGKYVAFLDHDDLWIVEKLSAQLKALEQTPSAAVAYSWITFIDEQGAPLGSGEHIVRNGRVLGALLRGNFLWTASNPLIRRKVFDITGGFDETIGPADDWDMWLRLAAHCDFVCTEAVHVLYRVSPDSLSRDPLLVEHSALQVLGRAFARDLPGIDVTEQELLSQLYEDLTVELTKGIPTRERSRVAARFWRDAIRHDTGVLIRMWRRPWVLRALFKLGLGWVFPRRWLKRFWSHCRITTV